MVAIAGLYRAGVVTTALLLGGAPGAGKTTLGRAVAAQLGWDSLTGDDLLTAVRMVTTPKTHPAFHPIGEAGHLAYFTNGHPEQLIADAIATQDAAWPVVRGVLRRRQLVGHPVVVDWWLLDPRKVAATAPRGTASAWLHIDADVLLERERANQEFFRASSDPQRMLDNFMARSLWRNQLVRDAAAQLHLPIIHQDGSRAVEELTDEVISRLGLE